MVARNDVNNCTTVYSGGAVFFLAHGTPRGSFRVWIMIMGRKVDRRVAEMVIIGAGEKGILLKWGNVLQWGTQVLHAKLTSQDLQVDYGCGREGFGATLFVCTISCVCSGVPGNNVSGTMIMAGGLCEPRGRCELWVSISLDTLGINVHVASLIFSPLKNK